MSHNSNRGATTELAFATEASRHGLVVAMPFSVETYDVLVRSPIEHSSWVEIQVKTAHWNQSRNAYRVNCTSQGRHYRFSDFDYLAVYVPHERGLWYILPRESITQGTLWFRPDGGSSGRELWRERWDNILRCSAYDA